MCLSALGEPIDVWCTAKPTCRVRRSHVAASLAIRTGALWHVSSMSISICRSIFRWACSTYRTLVYGILLCLSDVLFSSWGVHRTIIATFVEISSWLPTRLTLASFLWWYLCQAWRPRFAGRPSGGVGTEYIFSVQSFFNFVYVILLCSLHCSKWRSVMKAGANGWSDLSRRSFCIPTQFLFASLFICMKHVFASLDALYRVFMGFEYLHSVRVSSDIVPMHVRDNFNVCSVLVSTSLLCTLSLSMCFRVQRVRFCFLFFFFFTPHTSKLGLAHPCWRETSVYHRTSCACLWEVIDTIKASKDSHKHREKFRIFWRSVFFRSVSPSFHC